MAIPTNKLLFVLLFVVTACHAEGDNEVFYESTAPRYTPYDSVNQSVMCNVICHFCHETPYYVPWSRVCCHAFHIQCCCLDAGEIIVIHYNIESRTDAHKCLKFDEYYPQVIPPFHCLPKSTTTEEPQAQNGSTTTEEPQFQNRSSSITHALYIISGFILISTYIL